jgi:signal transduction histidine kinase
MEGEKCYSAFMKSNKPCEFCRLNEVIETGKIGQIEVVAADGRNYQVSSSSFTDVDGEVKLIEMARDITEKKALEAEVMRAGHLASIGELAAGVAHEINNPINGIINYAQILLDQSDGEGEEAEILSRIIKEGDRIADIVKNLLIFARDQKEEFDQVFIQEIIDDVFGLVKRQILKDGVQLKVDIPPHLPRIKAVRRQIQQVFLNILSNARYALNQKYPGAHENKILKISCEMIEMEGRRYIRTTFYDHGTGIPADVLDKICNPFFSTKPPGEGTGLGLSISHGIIRDHEGKLWFESVEGEYTKVTVDLPVREKEG